MEKYYFTFGSWEKFPYQNTYLIVVASGYEDAIKGFREKHPDITPNCMNCSDCYTEILWERVGHHYAGMDPAEIIWTESCFGKKPEGYDDLFIFVPGMKQIIRLAEGCGDNLLPSDIEDGYVDYIYYEQYELDNGMPEIDGGKVLLEEMLRDKYQCLADCIPDVLDMAYSNKLEKCMILEQEDKKCS